VSVTVRNQPLLFGNRVRGLILKGAASYVLAAENLVKMVSVPDSVKPFIEAVLMGNATTAHKRQQQIGWV
jgi:hypothetical protein